MHVYAKIIAMGYGNPFGKSVFYTIVLFAVTHLAISFFAGMWQGDTAVVNMFHVLGLDLIWPELGMGALNSVLGVLVIVGAWGILGWILRWRDITADKKREASKHKRK